MPLFTRIKQFISRDRNIVLLIAVCAVLVYMLCLPNQMFWDDEDFILKNMYIHDWQFWPKYFTDNIIAGAHLVSNYWRPLLQVVFAIEWHLWADWVWGWHAVSILCHATAGILLFFMLNLLLGHRILAILGSLLWLVHPVHTEAIVYPNSLGDPLATIFILAGVCLYARYRRSGITAARNMNWWLAILMYPLALLSKETGILLVAFIALTDFFFLTPDDAFFKKIKRIGLSIWPFIAIAAIYMALRATVLNLHNSFNFYDADTAFTTHFDMRLFTFFRVIALYAGFIFTPYDLRVERTIDTPNSLFIPDVLWGAALCALLIALAIRNREKRPAVTFGVLWFFAAILPTSNLLVIINALVYEHFLYIALIGILIVVLTLGLAWTKDKKNRRIFLCTLMGIIVIFGARSAWRCTDWRTAIIFYEQLLPTAPASYRVINNLGMAYAEKGIIDKAEATYTKAITLDPNNAVAYHNLANIYRGAGRTDLARQNYEKAIALQENFIFSYKSLAQIYIDNKEYAKARRLLEKYYALADEKIYTLGILTEIAYREGAYADARQYLLALQQLQPDNPNIASALQRLDAAVQKK